MSEKLYYAVTEEHKQYLEVIQQAYIAMLKKDYDEAYKRFKILETELQKAQEVQFLEPWRTGTQWGNKPE